MIATQLPQTRSRRAGFTLIELLGVIAIIAILMALSAGAYFRVRVSQQESATNTTVQKLQSQLQVQWDAVLDIAKEDARKNAIPANVQSFAGNDSRRSLVVWSKIRLRVEFPQNFDEAVNYTSFLQTNTGIVIPQKSTYKQAITGYGITPTPAGSLTTDQAHRESAALLYIALTQGQRGMQAFDPENHIGAHAVSNTTLYGTQFKVFADTWGQPIAFIRWPTGANAARDINQDPFWVVNTFNRTNPLTGAALTQPITLLSDPQDPEWTLYANAAHWSNANRTLFTKFIHPLNAQQVGPVNLSPFVFSGGRDNASGAGTNWGVAPDFSYTGTGEDDNIYGYRLRGVGKK